jgi:HTH-type transcriptional regulator/antitoxin HigA
VEAQGLTHKDLAPVLGGRGRVSEVLARKRPLSLTMIRKLAKTLHIPAEVLIQPYAMEDNPTAS